MAVDHNRPLPVELERLDAWTKLLWPTLTFARLSKAHQIDVLKLALQEQQIEATRQVEFYLREAYDIYNARFR